MIDSTAHDRPRALVITTAGINCDLELARAFELAGARAEPVHLNRLMQDPSMIEAYDLVGLPGGFSYGDAVAAGRIAAQLMRRTIHGALVQAVARGVPMIAPCNGFQVAVQVGLLPGPPPGESWTEEPPEPTVALAVNDTGRFADRWVRVSYPSDSRCIWTAGLDPPPHDARLPIAHGEGRFVVASDAVLETLRRGGQVAVRYATDDNPNGSVDDIAGICDASGLVLGLMPHPERWTRWTQHPFWTRLDASTREGDPPGLAMFRAAVRHVMSRRETCTVGGG